MAAARSAGEQRAGVFGKCPARRAGDGELASRWLAKTIRRAKNEPTNGHGLITEILTCGQLTVIGGSLELAQENQRGYDTIARHVNGWTHYISIKNRDVSDKEKAFHQAGHRIRRAWQDRLRLDHRSGGLNVVSIAPLEAAQEQAIIQHIRTASSITGKWALLNDSAHITMVPPYPHLGPLNATRNSDHVIFVASQPPSEQARFKTELRKAAQQLGKNVAREDKACNVIHMRVHPSADLALLESAAQELLAQPDAEFDAVLFLQPSVVRENDQSRINHAVRFAMGSRYLDFIRDRGPGQPPPYGYRFGIGSVSTEPSRMVLSSAEGIASELPPHAYVFQEGDYYLDTIPDDRGGYGATIVPSVPASRGTVSLPIKVRKPSSPRWCPKPIFFTCSNPCTGLFDPVPHGRICGPVGA